jgi:nucleotide-binding universal stress UspA family protein
MISVNERAKLTIPAVCLALCRHFSYIYLIIERKSTPMKNKFITLATLTYMRAQLLSARLEEQGIESFMTHLNMIKESAGGVNIIVKAEDLPAASEILGDFLKAYGKEKQVAVEYMRSVRRILVPVDFSPHAENAVSYALAIAAKLKADIQLLNVYFDPVLSPYSHLETYTFAANLDQITREIEAEAAENLVTLANEMKKKLRKHRVKGVNVYYDLVKGNAVDTILNYIKEYKPGLLVMGTRGSELEGHRSFGSVTAKVIEKAKIPVLAVPKGYDASAFKTPDRVMYATNFDDTDYWALSKLASFVKPFGSMIYCLHVSDEIEKSEEVLMQKVRHFIIDTLGIKQIECGLLECMDPQMGLEDFIKEKQIELVSITTHQHSLFDKLFLKTNMTRKFLFQTDIPLLIFHARPKVG